MVGVRSLTIVKDTFAETSDFPYDGDTVTYTPFNGITNYDS